MGKELSALTAKGYWDVQFLGQGGFGDVYSVRDPKTNEKLAIKVIDRSIVRQKRMERYIETEISSLLNVKSDYVVKMFESSQDDDYIYLVMECCDDNLKDYLKKQQLESKGLGIEEMEAREIVYQILKGQLAIHKAGYTHRDIKLLNILVKDGRFKIADFGLAKQCVEMMSTLVGTLSYKCPELLEGQNYNYKCDIWSIGVVYFELLFDTKPFQVQDQKTQLQKIKEVCQGRAFRVENLNFQNQDRIKKMEALSEESKTFFERVFCYSQEERIDYQGIFKLPFITELQSFKEENQEIMDQIEDYSSGEILKQIELVNQRSQKELGESYEKLQKPFDPVFVENRSQQQQTEGGEHSEGFELDSNWLEQFTEISNQRGNLSNLTEIEENWRRQLAVIEEQDHLNTLEKHNFDRKKYLLLLTLQQELNGLGLDGSEYSKLGQYLLVKQSFLMSKQLLNFLLRDALFLEQNQEFIQSRSYSILVNEVACDNYQINQILRKLSSELDERSSKEFQQIKNYDSLIQNHQTRLIYNEMIENSIKSWTSAPESSRITLKIIICEQIGRLLSPNSELNSIIDNFAVFKQSMGDKLIQRETFFENLLKWISGANPSQIRQQVIEILKILVSLA